MPVLLYDLLMGVATNVVSTCVSSKALSLLKKKKGVVVDSPLMRAFLRALIGSIIQLLDTWSNQNVDADGNFVSFSKKKLEDSRTECEKEFLSFVDDKHLQKMLEGLRRRETVDSSVLAEKALNFLCQLWSAPGYDIPESFRAYVREGEGRTFSKVLLEKFGEEVKKPDVFNSFIADFLTKIYKKLDVEKAFPSIEVFEKFLGSIEAKIGDLPQKIVDLIKEEDIVLTVEAHRRILEKERDDLRVQLTTAHEQEQEQLTNRIIEIQSALSDKQRLIESYCEKIIQLVEQIKRLESRIGDLPDVLMNRAIEALRRGDMDTADRVFKEIDVQCNPYIEMYAESQYQQGMIAKNRVCYSDAYDLFSQAVTLMPNDDWYWNGLGTISGILGRHEDSLRFYQRALQIKSENLPQNHPDIARQLTNLGVAWWKLGDIAKARERSEEALKIQKISLSPDDPDIATSLNNIGVLFCKEKNFDAAISYFEEALKIQQKSNSPDFPDIARTYSNLGVVWHGKNNYENAIFCHNKALEIEEKQPSLQVDMAGSYYNLGRVWCDKGDLREAIEFHEKALEIREKVLPPGHPDTVESHMALKKLRHDLAMSQKDVVTFK